MDKNKIASEILKCAKTLMADNHYLTLDKALGKASVALSDLDSELRRDKMITDSKVKKEILKGVQDAIEALDKAGDILLEYEKDAGL